MTNYNFAQLESIWTQAGGNPVAAPMAAAIALAESGGNPNASNANGNGTIDRGLWQINSIHGAQSTFDITANARGAVAISSNGSNWRPWCTAWSNGRCGGTFEGAGSPYLKHLPSGAVPPSAVTVPSTPTGNVTPPPLGGKGGQGGNSGAPLPGLPSVGDVTGLGNLSDTMAQIYNSFTKTLWFGFITGFGILLMFGGLAILLYTTRVGQAVMGAIPGSSYAPSKAEAATGSGSAPSAPSEPSAPAQSSDTSTPAQRRNSRVLPGETPKQTNTRRTEETFGKPSKSALRKTTFKSTGYKNGKGERA